MQRIVFPAVLALSSLFVAGCGEGPPDEGSADSESSMDVMNEGDLVEQAREIHERVIAIDTHVDIPFDFATEAADPGQRGRFQNDLPKMREGGLDAAFFIVYHGQGERNPPAYEAAYERALRKFEGVGRMASEMYPDQIELAESAADVRRIDGEGKLVALIGVENAYSIGTDLSRVAEWHALGARYMSPTHNGHSQFGDAAVERPDLGDDGPEWGATSTTPST